MTTTRHNPTTPSSAWARLSLGLTASLSALALALHQGRGPLGTPPASGLRFASIEAWYQRRTPVEVSLGVIRVLTMIVAIGGVALFALALVSALLARTPRTSLHHLSATLAALLPRRLRRWRDLAAGLGLSAAIGLTTISGANATTGPRDQVGQARTTIAGDQRPTMAPIRKAGDPASGQHWPDIGRPRPTSIPITTTPATTRTSPTTTSPATTTSSPTTTTPATTRTSSTSTAAATSTTPSVPATTAPVAIPADHTYVVRPGDSFWSIAEDAVSRANPDAPESDISEYWVALIAANRALLPDPSNPDVLLVGTTIRLPRPG